MAIKIKYAQLTIRDYKDPVYSNCVLIIEIVHSKLVLSTSSKLLNLKKNYYLDSLKQLKNLEVHSINLLVTITIYFILWKVVHLIFWNNILFQHKVMIA